jgi:hypothetical protein
MLSSYCNMIMCSINRFHLRLYFQAQPKGFLGALRERGVGGARCGATAATVVLLPLKGTEEMFDIITILFKSRASGISFFCIKTCIECERCYCSQMGGSN